MRPSVRRLSVLLATSALVTAGLLAVAGAAQAATYPSTVDFGSVPVGSSETISFTVTPDDGYAVGVATGTGLNPPWSFAFGDCSSGPGACTPAETFSPSATGSATGTLRLFECPTAGGTCIPLDINLTGVGVTVTSGTMSVTPSSAAPGGSFTATSTTPCPAGTHGVTVQLLDSGGNPIATHAGLLNTGGSWAGSVAVPSGAAAGPAFVTAVCDNGHGLIIGDYNFVPVTISAPTPPPTPAAFSVTPSTLDFGTVHMGHSLSLTATVTNTGGQSLTFTSVTISAGTADFKLGSNTCSGALAGGASCFTSVTFKPTVGNTRLGTLRYNDTVGTQTVALSGRGCFLICGG